MTQIIKEKSSNMGALSNFLNKNIEYLKHLEKNIPKEAIGFSVSEKVYYFLNN